MKLKLLRKIDLSAILALVIVWAIVIYLLNLTNINIVFEVSIFVTSVFVTFAALLIKKFGVVTLFYIIAGILTLLIPHLINLGSNTVFILPVTGLTFEFIYFILKKTSVGVILATSISNGTMPWIMLLFGGATTIPGIERLMTQVWNFTITNIIIGFIGTLIGFGIWYRLKNTKVILRFEYTGD